MDDGEVLSLCDRIREISLALHRYLRHGHLEKVYENGLAHRLQKAGIRFEQQHPLKVLDEDGATLGEYYADFLVEDCLVVELKACKALVDEHVAQILGYLRACQMTHGLLINFGAPRLEIRKFKL
jgi:GxxExxY protein